MNKKVVIYSTNSCVYCKQAKAYLKSKGVGFEEKYIDDDEAVRKELMDKIGGAFRGVPVIDIGGEMLQGFDRVHINLALENL
jgi:glutaredoxin